MDFRTGLCTVTVLVVISAEACHADLVYAAADARIAAPPWSTPPDGGSVYLSVFNNAPYWPENNVQRTLVRFALPPVPAGKEMGSATLTLFAGFFQFGTNPNGSEMSVYRMTRSWSESDAIWETAAVGDPWASPGALDDAVGSNGLKASEAGVAPYSVSTANPTFEDAPVTWDVTSLVADWYAGSPNYGVLLQAPRGVALHFRSREYAGPTLGPQLNIEFVPEPSAFSIFGLLGLGLLRRQRSSGLNQGDSTASARSRDE